MEGQVHVEVEQQGTEAEPRTKNQGGAKYKGGAVSQSRISGAENQGGVVSQGGADGAGNQGRAGELKNTRAEQIPTTVELKTTSAELMVQETNQADEAELEQRTQRC